MAEEFELTLRVCGGDTQSLFETIAGMRRLGGCTLVPGETLHVRDEYFDTDSLGLAEADLALRIRRAGRGPVLCLKGRERVDVHGAVRRLEIEGPWSQETLDRVLEAAGKVLHEHPVFLPDDPGETLSRMGLKVIQSRGMTRIVLDVLPSGGLEGRPAAELALDTVCYRLGQGAFVHREVEIEARPGGQERLVHEIGSLLQEAFPGTLCPWRPNKLATGLALQALTAAGGVPYPPPAGTPVPEPAYGLIEDWIRAARHLS